MQGTNDRRHATPHHVRSVFSRTCCSPATSNVCSFSRHPWFRVYISQGPPSLRTMSPILYHCVLLSRFLLYWLFLHSLNAPSRHLVTASGCYFAYNSTVLPSPNYVEPCGMSTLAEPSFLNCCVVQSQNFCMSNSICYAPYTDDGKYYLSPCTDPTYNASVCPRYCSKSMAMSLTSPQHLLPSNRGLHADRVDDSSQCIGLIKIN